MPTPRHKISLRALAIFAAIAFLASGCVTRTVRRTFYEDTTTRVVFVGKKRSGEAVSQGYSHPLQIAPVRMAHILSRVDVRVEKKDQVTRMPAIQTDALYELADHLASAFSEADPSQYLAVYYTRRDKRFGVFDRRFLTSFLVFAQDEKIYLHLGKVDWEIPKTGRREKIPEPKMNDQTDAYRVVVSTGMTVTSPNSVLIDWQNPVFKKPTRTHIAPGGKVVRRTILMEAPEEPEPAPEAAPAPAVPQALSSATLRALADLEGERERGEVTEGDYDIRKRKILAADPSSR